MINEYTINGEVSTAYHDEYVTRAQNAKPLRNSVGRALRWGGAVGIILGTISAVASAGILIGMSAAMALPFMSAGLVTIAASTLSSRIGCRIRDRLGITAGYALQDDIKNGKLLQRFFKEELVNEGKRLDRERQSIESEYYTKTNKLSEDLAALSERRKVALELISRSMTSLERQVEAAQHDLDFFRKETAALAPVFDAATGKPPAGSAPADEKKPPPRIISHLLR